MPSAALTASTAHYGAGTWDLTAMAGRADQGVFNMNGNPELNVDLQYLAFTQIRMEAARAVACFWHRLSRWTNWPYQNR